MVIEGEDYKLQYDSDHDRFDLYLLKVINAKDPEKRREEFVLYGYSMHLDSCLKKIINYRINKGNHTLDLKTYLEQYHTFVKALQNIVKTVNE